MFFTTKESLSLDISRAISPNPTTKKTKTTVEWKCKWQWSDFLPPIEPYEEFPIDFSIKRWKM